MDEQIRQIGERLRGLREVLDIPAEEVAELCDITPEHYMKIESGEADPSVYRLSKIAKRYGIALDVLMLAVERRKSYKYQSLASGFRGRKFDPFMTQVDPLPDDARFSKNSHDGQEFDYIVEGRMEITIGNKVMELGPGDSIFFDASQPHCMRALDGRPVKFLVVVE